MNGDFPQKDFPRTIDDPVSEILIQALELEGEALRLLLDEACGKDAELRAEVESLLAVHEKLEDDGFLAIPAAEQLATLTDEQLPPQHPEEQRPDSLRSGPRPLLDNVGGYKLIKRLGEGGMGTVFLAEQHKPVRRRIALKVIRILHREDLQRRFAIECQALAKLNHPNIAALYEVGETENGGSLPFVAMEWVDGSPITRWCDEAQADLKTRLQIFLGLCSGITHAHQKGVLHCDLKPSNVLVTRVGGQAIAKVIDFGIARAIGEPLVDSGESTHEMLLGSPPYISPESLQLGGRHNLDARSDVYSLGLLLYELLVGVLPFEVEGVGIFAILRLVNDQDPPEPSHRFETLAADDAKLIADRLATSPKKLVSQVHGDLDAIVMKAIDRDPRQRYGSPAALAEDIERHLGNYPVLAKPSSLSYRAACFVRRHGQAVFAALALLAALIGGFIAQSIEANRAQRALAESNQVRAFLVELFERANPERAIGEAMTVHELLDQGVERLRQDLPSQPLTRAQLLQTIGSVYTKLDQLGSAAETIHEALEIRRQHLPARHPDVIESESEIGVIYRRLGQYSKAEPYLLSVLEARRAEPDLDLELLARAYSNLGNLYWSQERFEEAETLHREALDLRRKMSEELGTAEARSNEALSANNLGVMLQGRGQFEEARPILLRAVDILKAENHALLGSALNNLGIVERNLPTWKKAEGLFHQAISVHEASVGPLHSRPLSSRLNLVYELTLRHRWEEAEVEGNRMVEYGEQIDDALGLARMYRSLGGLHLKAGNKTKAVEAYLQAVDVMMTTQGSEHPDTLRSRGNLAVAWAQAGNTEAALNELGKITATLRKYTHEDHPIRLRFSRDAAQVGLALGNFLEAESRLKRYIEGQGRIHGNDSLPVAVALHELGQTVAAQGRLEEARDFFYTGLEIRKKRYGEEHPLVAESAHELGLLQMKLQNVVAARGWLQTAFDIRLALYPPNDPHTEASRKALQEVQ